MSEYHDRCRYWPHCDIHLGETRPRAFSPANRDEMRQLRAQGWRYTEIGAAFGTSYRVAAALVRAT